jgi:DNA polymerase III alpha subunit (gram-positive type)
MIQQYFTGNLKLVGSPKQVDWARRIIHKLQEETDKTLPIIKDAQFWISHRNSSIDDIFTDAIAVSLDLNFASTAFTTRYSRYGRADAMQALDVLDNAIVLDTETTGLLQSKKSEIIELSIVELNTGNILFDSLLKPFHFEDYGSEETRKAQEVHKISREELEKAPTLPDVWPLLCSILVSHQIVAFNDGFDVPMLRRSISKWNIQPPRLYSTCAMKIFSSFVETDEYFSLDYACNYMNIDRKQFGDSHRSLADVLATCALIRALRQS